MNKRVNGTRAFPQNLGLQCPGTPIPVVSPLISLTDGMVRIVKKNAVTIEPDMKNESKLHAKILMDVKTE
jgi:hypothetical protein